MIKVINNRKRKKSVARNVTSNNN